MNLKKYFFSPADTHVSCPKMPNGFMLNLASQITLIFGVLYIDKNIDNIVLLWNVIPYILVDVN